VPENARLNVACRSCRLRLIDDSIPCDAKRAVMVNRFSTSSARVRWISSGGHGNAIRLILSCPMFLIESWFPDARDSICRLPNGERRQWSTQRGSIPSNLNRKILSLNITLRFTWSAMTHAPTSSKVFARLNRKSFGLVSQCASRMRQSRF
jgi:hypothetical protein